MRNLERYKSLCHTLTWLVDTYTCHTHVYMYVLHEYKYVLVQTLKVSDVYVLLAGHI